MAKETGREKLERLLFEKFSSTWAASQAMGGVPGHQQLENVLSGQTPLWNLRVMTAQRIIEALGMSWADFKDPRASEARPSSRRSAEEETRKLLRSRATGVGSFGERGSESPPDPLR